MTEFQKWMEENKARFATYSITEISDIAIACGFPREEIAQWTVQRRWEAA